MLPESKSVQRSHLLLDLLHGICERCPLAEDSGVTVNCSIPGHETHSVSPCGFVLLEEVEETFGSAEQGVKKIVIDDLKGPLLTALSSRLVRQGEVKKKISLEVDEVEYLSIYNKEDGVIDYEEEQYTSVMEEDEDGWVWKMILSQVTTSVAGLFQCQVGCR